MAKNVRLAAREAMQRFAYDPIEVLVQLAQQEGASHDMKKEVAQTLLPYMYPKLSNVTLDGEVRTTDREQGMSLMQKILSNPKLADAAQVLSMAAAEEAMATIDDGSGGLIQ